MYYVKYFQKRLSLHLVPVTSGLVFTIASLVLIGWRFKIEALKSISPHYITMKANAAVSLILLAMANLLLSPPRPGQETVQKTFLSPKIFFGVLSAAFAMTIALLTLIEYRFGVNFKIDELLFLDPPVGPIKFPPGRLAPIMALITLLTGSAQLIIAHPKHSYFRVSQTLAFLCFVLSFQAFIGYLLGITYTFGYSFYTQMAVHTCVSLVIICVGLLANQRDQGWIKILFSDTAGGKSARNLLGFAILVPPLVNWVQNEGQNLGLYDADFGKVIFITGNVVFFLFVILKNAVEIHHSEMQRKADQKAIQSAQVELLARERTEIAIRQANLALQTATRIKSEFLANVSHEIRTPINGVLGMINLLLETPLNPTQKEYSETARSSAETLLSLVNDILDFSKADSGKMSLESIDFNLEQVVTDIERTLVFMIRKKNLKFTATIAPDLPKYLVGDPTRLRQILLNLVNNSLKFTHRGQVAIRVKAENELIRFEVSDTGIGISKESLGQMFQSFSQADSSTTRKYGGTGLGLSICRNLVKLMGGEIGVRSQPNFGSTFWFTLPLVAGKLPLDSGFRPRELSILSEPNFKLRILVAEDNSVNQLIAIKMLEKMGHVALAVANGNEVIGALEAAPYDLVLMDCQMPEVDGYEATRIIRANAKTEYAKIPIIAMTANAMNGDREKCLMAGMNNYISKPVKAEDLNLIIRQTLRRPLRSPKIAA